MTSSPLVSVVIPTHNRRDLLPETVDSVLEQAGVDLQVIVVDDDSKDGTEEYLAGVDDPRFSYRLLRPGRLGSGARNHGFEDVRSPYVLFLDDDDILRPGSVKALLDELVAHPGAARVVGAHEIFGEGMGRRRGLHPRFPITARTWKAELFRWNMPPAAMLWRTEVVREIGGWTEGLRRAEDAELCLRSWRYPTRVIPDVVLDYRCHPGQAQTATTWNWDMEARQTFVDILEGRPRRQAERILASRVISQTALEHYLAREYGRALVHFLRVAVRTPSTAASPIAAPWTLGFIGKSFVGTLIPQPIAVRLSRGRRARRGAVPDNRRAEALARSTD